MQDSFDARMQGQVPEVVKRKSSKGWMICSVILLFIMIGGGIFAGTIIAKGDRDTNKLSEVEQQIKEKDDKIAELEKKIESLSNPTDGDTDADKEASPSDGTTIDKEDAVKSELDTLIKNKEGGSSYTYKINKFGLTKDQKYYYAFFTISYTGGTNDSMVYYRAAQGGTWKYMNGGHAVSSCTDFDADVLSFMKQYGKEVVNYCQCSDDDGTVHNYSKE